MAVFKATKNKSDSAGKFKATEHRSYDSALVSDWETRSKESYDALEKYRQRINSGGYLSADDLAAYRKALDSYVETSTSLRGVSKAFGQGKDDDQKWTETIAQMESGYKGISDYFSQWKTEDAFKKAIEASKEREAKLSLDTAAYSKELDALVAQRDAYIQELDASDSSIGTDNVDRAAMDLVGKIEELEKQIQERKLYLNDADRLQEGVRLASVSGNDDFDENSGYVSTEYGEGFSWDKLLKNDYGLGYEDLTYEYINNQNGIRGEFDRKASIYGKGSGDTENRFAAKGYDLLNEDEVAIYNYYYAKDGKEAAEKYLDSIQETLNTRKATGMFEKLEDNALLELAFGVAAGLDQFESGMKGLGNAITGNEEYMPPSATQIASGMVREDMSDIDLKWYNFKDKNWGDAKIFGNSLGQAGYDAVTTGSNMLPSILTSAAVNFVAPGAGSIVGTSLLGASAGGNAYQEMINLGYDKGQARSYAALVGCSEALLQYALGGISKLGGGSNGIFQTAAGKLLPHVDKAFARTAIKLGANMLDEGLEEGLQEILTPWFQNLVLNADASVNWDEVMYSSLLGALTAGIMEGPGTVVGEVNAYTQGRKPLKADISAERLAELGKTFAADTEAYQLAGKVNENTGAYTIGRLFNEIGATMTEQNVNDITNALVAKGLDEVTARKNAEALAYVVEGGKLTDKQTAIIEANEGLAEVARSVLIDANSTVNQSTKGYNEALMALAQEKTGAKSSRTNPAQQSEENAPTTDTVDTLSENGEESASEADTGPAKVKSIASIKNKRATVALEDGTEADVRDVDLDPDDGVRIETIASIDGISSTDANFIFKTLRENTGASAQMDSLGAKDAYRYGFYGFSKDLMTKQAVFANSLTAAQRDAIYEVGQKARQQQIDSATPKTTAKQRGIYFDHGGGNVVEFKDADKKTLTEDKRKAGVQAALILNKLGIGGSIYFYESYRNANGQLVYKDANGIEKKAPNGWYSKGDGSIHIDLNAGKEGHGFVLFTLAHELTHFIEQWSPAKYKILADFLIENYEKGQSMDALVKKKQDALSKNRREAVSYNEAYSEVIADSMEAMLADGNVLEKLIELKAKDQSLFAKMKQFFDNLLAKLRNAYKGQTPDSAEGKAVLEMTESIERIQQLFAEALVEASENFQSAEKNATQEGGEVQHSLREFEDGTRFVDVQMDAHTFDGMTVAEMNKTAKAILMERFAGKVIGIDNRAFVNGDSVNEYLHPSKAIDLDTRKVKLTAAGELDNLLDAGTTLPNRPDGEDGHIHPDAIDFSYFKTIFKVGNEYFEGVVNIKNIKRGKLLKDITKIKNITQDIVSSYGVNPKSNFLRDVSMYSIRDEGGNVNTESSEALDVEFDANTESVAPSVQLSDRDSEGSQLSAEQQEFFKHSKIVDADGNLKVMHHGSPESFTVFDKKKAKASGYYGKGFYFTDSDSHAKQYGNTYDVYLNITNPLQDGTKEITKDQLRKFVEAIAENEDYGIDNYGYDATVDSVTDSVYGKSDFAMLMDINASCVGNMVEAIELFNEVNGTDYNGIVAPTETVAFSAEQIKDVGNKTPTTDPDIRYSERIEDSVSNRSLLANAFEGVAQNDIEKRKIQEYKSQISLINAEERKLSELNQKIKDLSFAKGQKDTKAIRALQFEAMQTANRINTMDKILLRLEASKPLQNVLQREKKMAYDLAKQKGEETLAAYRLKAEAKQSETLRDYRETRAALRHAKSDAAVMEREFIRIAKAYEKLDAKSTAKTGKDAKTIADLKAALKEEAQKHRDDQKTWEAEFNRLVREYEASGRSIAELEEKIERQKANAKARVETREKREAREKLHKLVLDTAKWISYPSKTDVKCPDILKQPYSDFLNGIDLSSKRLAEGGDPTKNDLRLANAMDSLATALDRITDSQDPSRDPDQIASAVLDAGYLDLPAGFVKKLRDMTENVKQMMVEGEFVVNNMSAAEVRQLSQMIRTLNHAIKEVSRLYANLRFANVEALGDATMAFMDSLGEIEKSGGMKDFVEWDNALPYYAFKRFGNGGESIFEGLMDSQDKLAFLAQQIFDFQEKTWKEEEAKAWSEDTHTIELPSGNSLVLTTADAMSIYCLSRREHALPHLLGGGVRVMGIEKGSQKAKDSRSTLTIEDINTIHDSLTDRQKKVADALQAFMSTTCSEWGNEISMKRFLTKEFNEKFYFPIESNDENLPTKDPAAQQSDLFRLLNISATKPLTEGANNEVVIRNVFDVFTNHASDMARLNAYGMALLDYMKWLNYREKSVNEEGQIKVRGVRKSMEKAYGKAARSYALNLIKDVNGRPSDNGDPTMLMHWMRNAKIASVGANLRVAALQFTAYPRAAMVLSTRSIALGLTKAPQIVKAKKYCGIALWKSFGFYDTNIARSIEDQMKGVTNIRQKIIELSMKGAEWGDAIAWGCLWNACEYEVASTKKHKVGSEEFYQEVGKKLREVVYATQVVDSTLTRSQLMRSKRGMAQEAASFMSEPTLTANILMDARFQFEAEKRRTGSVKAAWNKAGTHIGRAVAVYSCVALLGALVESLGDAWRDDDDEEFYKKFFEALPENILLNMLPFNKVPIVSDVFELAMSFFDIGFFSSEKLSTQWLSQTASAVDAWGDVFSGKSTATVYGALYKTVKAFSSTTGIPFSGAVREVASLWNNTAGSFNSAWKLRTYGQTQEDLRNGLYEAIVSGNQKQVESIQAEFRERADDDKDYQSTLTSAIRKALRENDPRILEAAQAVVSGNAVERARIAREIEAEGNFKLQDIQAAINAEIDKLRKEAKGK